MKDNEENEEASCIYLGFAFKQTLIWCMLSRIRQ